MKRFVVAAVVVGVMAAAFAGLMRHVEAGQPQPGEKDVLQQLQKDLQAVEADLADLAKKHEVLRKDYDTLKAAFQRHSHPVKFWDPEKKEAAAWTEQGSFFIAYPKVGAGDKDADAAKAGGTWGTP